MLDVIVENIGKRERLVLCRGTQKGGKLQARNKELLLLPAPDCQDTRRENLPGVADRSVHPDKTLQVQASSHTAVGFLLRQRGDECCYAPPQSISILKVKRWIRLLIKLKERRESPPKGTFQDKVLVGGEWCLDQLGIWWWGSRRCQRGLYFLSAQLPETFPKLGLSLPHTLELTIDRKTNKQTRKSVSNIAKTRTNSHILKDWSSQLLRGAVQGGSRIEVNNGHFLGAMGYNGFFLREPLASMVFRWFCSPLTITINYFFNNWPLDSMVFQWFWGHSTIAI